MVEIFYPDEYYPLEKDLLQICKLINQGKVVVFPTDTVYAIGCSLYNKDGIERILKITGKQEKKARLSVLCKDIKTISTFALPYSTAVFRAIKEYAPGPFTFILNANTFLGKLLKSSKKEIGVRIPSNPILQMILQHLETPMISTSLTIDGYDEIEVNDPQIIQDELKHKIDVLVVAPIEHPMASTVIDCTTDELVVVRQGRQLIEM
jgi:tRNA threonylcarbamoyl adenosine modification protein (Sua5/YciO/YrdC/YwlC family)